MPEDKVSEILQTSIDDSESEEETPLSRDQVIELMGFDEDNLEEYFSDRSSSFEVSDLEGDGEDTVITCQKLMSKKFLAGIGEGTRKKVYARTHDWPTSEIVLLGDEIAQTTSVKALKVACKDDALAALGEILKDNTTIEELSIECGRETTSDVDSDENSEDDEENPVPESTPNATHFFDAIAQNSSVKELALRQRLIHKEDIQMLIGVLQTNNILQKITIEWPYEYDFEPIVSQPFVEKLLEMGWSFSLDGEYGLAELCKEKVE